MIFRFSQLSEHFNDFIHSYIAILIKFITIMIADYGAIEKKAANFKVLYEIRIKNAYGNCSGISTRDGHDLK